MFYSYHGRQTSIDKQTESDSHYPVQKIEIGHLKDKCLSSKLPKYKLMQKNYNIMCVVYF